MSEQKFHAAFLLTISKKLELQPGLQIAGCEMALTGCKECLLAAITISMVQNAEFRKLINAAGIAANKIRRGEMDKPDFHSN